MAIFGQRDHGKKHPFDVFFGRIKHGAVPSTTFPMVKIRASDQFWGAGHQSSHADDDADAYCKDSY